MRVGNAKIPFAYLSQFYLYHFIVPRDPVLLAQIQGLPLPVSGRTHPLVLEVS